MNINGRRNISGLGQISNIQYPRPSVTPSRQKNYMISDVFYRVVASSAANQKLLSFLSNVLISSTYSFNRTKTLSSGATLNIVANNSFNRNKFCSSINILTLNSISSINRTRQFLASSVLNIFSTSTSKRIMGISTNGLLNLSALSNVKIKASIIARSVLNLFSLAAITNANHPTVIVTTFPLTLQISVTPKFSLNIPLLRNT